MHITTALKKAAEYRTDVRRFEIEPDGSWMAVYYRGHEAPKNTGTIDFDSLAGGEYMIEVLEQAMEKSFPEVRGKRPAAWFDACDRAFFRTVAEVEI